MEVDICHSKGQQRRLKRLVTYLFLIAGPPQAYKIQEDLVQSEVEDLIFDLILLVIVFALDDDAFEADIKSVEDIFYIRGSSTTPQRTTTVQKVHTRHTNCSLGRFFCPWRAHVSNEGITL